MATMNSLKGLLFGNKKRLVSREEQFGKGIEAFDKLVESVSVDGKRDDRDRDRLRSSLEQFVKDGLISPMGAKMLSEQYLLNVKGIPGKKRFNTGPSNRLGMGGSR